MDQRKKQQQQKTTDTAEKKMLLLGVAREDENITLSFDAASACGCAYVLCTQERGSIPKKVTRRQQGSSDLCGAGRSSSKKNNTPYFETPRNSSGHAERAVGISFVRCRKFRFEKRKTSKHHGAHQDTLHAVKRGLFFLVSFE